MNSKKSSILAALVALLAGHAIASAQTPAKSRTDYTDPTEGGAVDPAATLIRSDIFSLSGLYGEDGAYSLGTVASFAIGAKSQFSVDAAYSNSPQELADLSTYKGGLTFDHDFNPVGISMGYQYWGDRDRIESHALRGSIYVHGEVGRLAATYEHKEIDLEFEVPVGARGFVDNSRSASSQGYGLSAGLDTERFDLYANGMKYDYDVDLARLSNLIDISRVPTGLRSELLARINVLLFNLSRLNASSLTLAGSFLDYNVAVGIDIPIGDHSLNFELARDAAATDGLVLDSASIAFTQAIGDRFDMEYRIGASKGDNIDSSFYGGVTFYWYR